MINISKEINNNRLVLACLTGLSILLASSANADTCAVTEALSCTDLGYTTDRANCIAGAVCPFDTDKMACTTPKLAIGDFYLSNGTFSKKPYICNSSGTFCTGGGTTVVGIVVSTFGSGFPATIYSFRSPNNATMTWANADTNCKEGAGMSYNVKGQLINPPSSSYYDTINASISTAGWSFKLSTSESYFDTVSESGSKIPLCGIVINR
ncbi:MAG: hypothetical protein R3Y43_03310 [Alphaproteobacteria bacterium]